MRPLLTMLGVLLVTSACVQVNAPVELPRSLLFSSYKAPLQIDLDNVSMGSKHGTASTGYFHDPILTGMNFAWDEAAVAEAARNGAIEEIKHVDYELFHVLNIYARFTVHVYGD